MTSNRSAERLAGRSLRRGINLETNCDDSAVMEPKSGGHSIFKQQFLEQKVDALRPGTARSVSLTASTKDALEILQTHHEGALLVTDSNGKLAGIFSERDALTKLSCGGLDPALTPIDSVMTAKPISTKHFTTVARALFLMSDHGIRHLPVVNADQVPLSMLSVKQIVDYLHRTLARKVVDGSAVSDQYEPSAVERFLSRSVLSLSPKPVISVQGKDSTADVLALLCSKRIGSVLVVNGKNLVGIFTERDYLLKIALQTIKSNAPISALMTPNPKTVLNSNTIALALNTMSDGGFRHLPVVNESEHAIGVISVRDVLKAVVEGIIEQLQQR